MTTVYGRNSLSWKGRRLYYKSTLIEAKPEAVMAIRPHERLPSMFYVEWPDGVLSADFYNITRAKDHCIAVALAELNKTDLPLDL